MKVFRTKMKGHDQSASPLNSCLSALDLTLIGIGAIIGAGIFVLTGIAAATKAGPAVILSFVLSGVACSFAALSYAELASSIRGTGSAYNYAYAGLGELVAWIIGWALLLEYGLGACAIAIGWSDYFKDALISLGVSFPDYLLKNYLDGGWVNLPAVLIILLLTGILAAGVRESARLNRIVVFIKLVVIALFLIVSIPDLNPKNWHPFAPFGVTGVIEGAALIFFAYIGFDVVSTAAGESKFPQKDLTIAILVSLLFSTLVYILVSATLTGITSYQSLNTGSPVSDTVLRLGHRFMGSLISLGAIAGLTSGILIFMFGLSRILYAMGVDGLIPKIFGTVHPKTRAPSYTIILTGLILAGIAGFFPLRDVANFVNIGTLAAFIMVCASVIVLRYTEPNLERPFKTPWCPLIPGLGVLSCGFLMLNLPLDTWLRFLTWMALGLCVYFLFGYRHSALNKQEKM